MAALSSPTTRERVTERVAREHHDLLVVGGGIVGVAIARAAVLRGMAVALVERGDLASGTSGRSSRLIHGGLRYLQQRRVGFVRKSIRAQRALARGAPRLVQPLDFLVPIYADGPYRSEAMRAFMGVFRAIHIGADRLAYANLDARQCLAREPMLRAEGLVGGFRYREFMTHDARMVVETAIDACERGALVLSYASAEEILVARGGAVGVRVRDRLTGDLLEVRARTIVNATGPWAGELDSDRGLRLSKGVHLALPRERAPLTAPLVFFSPHDRRPVFAVPTARFVLVGTTESEHRGAPDAAAVDPADIEYLLEALDNIVALGLGPGDVAASWAALRPLLEGKARDPGSLSRDYAIERGRSGVLSVLGGKLSLHREMADDLLSVLGVGSSQGCDPPLPGEAWPKPRFALERALTELAGEAAAEHLVTTYGGRAARILARLESDSGLRDPLVIGLPHVRAELEHAAEDEMAIFADDYAWRRTDFAIEARALSLDPTPPLIGFGSAAPAR